MEKIDFLTTAQLVAVVDYVNELVEKNVEVVREKIDNEAYARGNDDGYSRGWREGYEDGYNDGYDNAPGHD